MVYLGTGLVIWNGISAAIGSAPNLFEHNQAHVHNTNLNPIFYVLEEWAFLCTDLPAILRFGVARSQLLPTQFAAELAGLWLVALLNLFLFLFSAPMIVCLLGARYRDFYQLVPIALQLVFLLSPILYRKNNLGAMAWTANSNSTGCSVQCGTPSWSVRCSGRLVC